MDVEHSSVLMEGLHNLGRRVRQKRLHVQKLNADLGTMRKLLNVEGSGDESEDFDSKLTRWMDETRKKDDSILLLESAKVEIEEEKSKSKRISDQYSHLKEELAKHVSERETMNEELGGKIEDRDKVISILQKRVEDQNSDINDYKRKLEALQMERLQKEDEGSKNEADVDRVEGDMEMKEEELMSDTNPMKETDTENEEKLVDVGEQEQEQEPVLQEKDVMEEEGEDGSEEGSEDSFVGEMDSSEVKQRIKGLEEELNDRAEELEYMHNEQARLTATLSEVTKSEQDVRSSLRTVIMTIHRLYCLSISSSERPESSSFSAARCASALREIENTLLNLRRENESFRSTVDESSRDKMLEELRNERDESVSENERLKAEVDNLNIILKSAQRDCISDTNELKSILLRCWGSVFPEDNSEVMTYGLLPPKIADVCEERESMKEKLKKRTASKDESEIERKLHIAEDELGEMEYQIDELRDEIASVKGQYEFKCRVFSQSQKELKLTKRELMKTEAQLSTERAKRTVVETSLVKANKVAAVTKSEVISVLEEKERELVEKEEQLVDVEQELEEKETEITELRSKIEALMKVCSTKDEMLRSLDDGEVEDQEELE